MPSRAGVKLRPTIERERLYRIVLELRKKGLSYNEIIKKVEDEHGVRLRKSHLSGWINSRHKPFGSVRAFEPTPRPELAYVIGVKMGDASMSVNKSHNYMIKLRVIDKEFAEEFSKCLAVILGRSPPSVRWHEKTRSWHTQVSGLLLQWLLRLDLQDLSPIVRHCKSCKGAFLRGFFDSEGSMSGRTLTVCNGDLDKLQFVCRLLRNLRVNTTGPHLKRKGGGTVSIKGKYYRMNKSQYYVYVRVDSLRTFRDVAGFTIDRKKKGLENAIRQ